MRYRDAVDKKRQQRELIKNFNKQYYQREREAKGIFDNEVDYPEVDAGIEGLIFYTKSGDIAKLVKVDGDTLYLLYRGKYIKGRKNMIGKSLFFEKI